MMPIVAGIVCGICGKRIERNDDDSHWLTHSLIERSRYWVRLPWLRIGPWVLSFDSTGIVLINRNKVAGNRVVWIWIFRRVK
jgi:hypothetical protein